MNSTRDWVDIFSQILTGSESGLVHQSGVRPSSVVDRLLAIGGSANSPHYLQFDEALQVFVPTFRRLYSQIGPFTEGQVWQLFALVDLFAYSRNDALADELLDFASMRVNSLIRDSIPMPVGLTSVSYLANLLDFFESMSRLSGDVRYHDLLSHLLSSGLRNEYSAYASVRSYVLIKRGQRLLNNLFVALLEFVDRLEMDCGPDFSQVTSTHQVFHDRVWFELQAQDVYFQNSVALPDFSLSLFLTEIKHVAGAAGYGANVRQEILRANASSMLVDIACQAETVGSLIDKFFEGEPGQSRQKA